MESSAALSALERVRGQAWLDRPSLIKRSEGGGCLRFDAQGSRRPAAAQCDLLRPLRLPGILVGDGRLGGISATLAALDTLALRGYEVGEGYCP